MTDDKVMITKEAQRFTRIYNFPEKSLVNTLTNFSNNLKVNIF